MWGLPPGEGVTFRGVLSSTYITFFRQIPNYDAEISNLRNKLNNEKEELEKKREDLERREEELKEVKDLIIKQLREGQASAVNTLYLYSIIVKSSPMSDPSGVH